MYHKALMNVLKEKKHRKFKNIWRERPLEKIGGHQVVGDRSRGRVDIVVEDNNSNFHAIELKIVQLPREKNLNPKQSLYDIGQITSDFARLSEANELSSYDCVIVMHGGYLNVYRTPDSVYREFHNRMFVDVETSKLAGEFKTERKKRKKQLEAVKTLGFDHPFIQKTKFVRVITVEGLGLVTICGPVPNSTKNNQN